MSANTTSCRLAELLRAKAPSRKTSHSLCQKLLCQTNVMNLIAEHGRGHNLGPPGTNDHCSTQGLQRQLDHYGSRLKQFVEVPRPADRDLGTKPRVSRPISRQNALARHRHWAGRRSGCQHASRKRYVPFSLLLRRWKPMFLKARNTKVQAKHYP
jgi:hypothetical protein